MPPVEPGFGGPGSACSPSCSFQAHRNGQPSAVTLLPWNHWRWSSAESSKQSRMAREMSPRSSPMRLAAGSGRLSEPPQTAAAATLILLWPLACLHCRTVTLRHLVHRHRQQTRGRQCSDPNQPLQRSACSCSLYSCSLCAATCSLWMAANPASICASRYTSCTGQLSRITSLGFGTTVNPSQDL